MTFHCEHCTEGTLRIQIIGNDACSLWLRERLKGFSASELAAIFEQHALPFAPITRPEDLLDDPHLKATGGLAPMTLPDGRSAQTVLLPFTLGGRRPGVRLDPPKLGEHNRELLAALGYSESEIEALSPPIPE